MEPISSAWSWLANVFEPAPPIYQPLGHREIRLVVLQPAKWNSPIKCHLIIDCLDEDPDYQALSYFWGDPKALRPISLQGRIVQISRNLESSLRHLRYEDRERTLWIDALSINQGDLIEKTQQVRQMHLIYARTRHLIVWVGERSEDSDTAMQAIRRIGVNRREKTPGTWIQLILRLWSRKLCLQASHLTQSPGSPSIVFFGVHGLSEFGYRSEILRSSESRLIPSPYRLFKKFAYRTEQSRLFAGKKKILGFL